MTEPNRAGNATDGLARNRRAIGWGFVDQSFSSATNLGLSLVAGRLLGPAGLGRVFLGFSIYLIVLNLQRRLLTEPLLSLTGALDRERRSRSASQGLAFSLSLALVSTFVLLILATTLLKGFAGKGLLLITPWLVPSLIQDYWRNVLFRDKRAEPATANDGLWFVVMLVTLPVVWSHPHDWVVMAWWGVGASAGAIFGFFQTRTLPVAIAKTWTWFRGEVWPFGKWNVAAGTVESLATQLEAFIVVGILGASAMGGLRAASTVFAPLSIIIPAIALPGLPAMARAVARGHGRKLAIELSVLAVAAAALYALFLFLGGWRLLPFLYGATFSPYRTLIWPVTAAQMFAAGQVGSVLLIKAERRGSVLMLTASVASVIGLALMVVFAQRYGLPGVAWAGAVMNLLSMSLFAIAALRMQRPAMNLPPGMGAQSRSPK